MIFLFIFKASIILCQNLRSKNVGHIIALGYKLFLGAYCCICKIIRGVVRYSQPANFPSFIILQTCKTKRCACTATHLTIQLSLDDKRHRVPPAASPQPASEGATPVVHIYCTLACHPRKDTQTLSVSLHSVSPRSRWP